jgi:uncharacterized coiled-coil DUF342 family protein
MDSKTIQTPVEPLYRELDELRTKNTTKRTEINLLRRKIEETIAERDALNNEVKKISTDVKVLKAKRDSLNAKVKELKIRRDELRDEAAKKREKLSKLLEQARTISEQLHGSMSEISTQINRLEWHIQTNPLAPQAERNLVARISALEASLAKHKGLKNVRDNLLQLKVEVGALRIRAQSIHGELTRIAEESEKVHTAMQEQLKNLAEKRKQADQRHAEYIEQSKQQHEAIVTLKSNAQRIEEIRDQIGEARTSTKIEKAEKVRSKYKEAANEKVRTGQKLSFEEFQALMGDSMSESDEE